MKKFFRKYFSKIIGSTSALISFLIHVILLVILFFIIIVKVADKEEEEEIAINIVLPPPLEEPVLLEQAEAGGASQSAEKQANKDVVSEVDVKVVETETETELEKKITEEDVQDTQEEIVELMDNIRKPVKKKFQKKKAVKVSSISNSLINAINSKAVTFGSNNLSVGGVAGDGLGSSIAAQGARVDKIDIRITLSWVNSNDLDLIVKPPKHSVLYFFKKTNASRGVLQNDMEGMIFKDELAIQKNRRFENVYWAYDSAGKGKYEVFLNIYDYRLLKDGISTYFIVEIEGASTLYTIKGNLSSDYGEDYIIKIATFTYKVGDIVKFDTEFNFDEKNLSAIVDDIIMDDFGDL